MSVNQYDEDPMEIRMTNKDKAISYIVQPAINAGSRRAASKKKIEYDDFYDDHSAFKVKRRNKASTGKFSKYIYQYRRKNEKVCL
jgi:hypothetical protein